MNNDDRQNLSSSATSLQDELVERLSKRLAKGSGFVLIGQAVGKVSMLFLQVALVRLLGAAAFGIYALATSTIQLVGKFSQLGMTNGLVRYVATDWADRDLSRLKGTILLAFLLSGSFSILLGGGLYAQSEWLAVHWFHTQEMVTPLRAMAIALPLFTSLKLVESALRGFQRINRFALLEMLRLVANAVLSVGLVIFGFQVLGAVWGFVAAIGATLGLAVLFLTQESFQTLKGKNVDWTPFRLIRFSLPLFISGFSFLVISRTDIIMLGYFVESEQVGSYRSALALANLVIFGLNAVNVAFAPMIADLYHRGSTESLGTLYRLSTRWIAMFSLTIATPLVLFSEQLLGVVFGPEVISAALALAVLAALQLVNAGTGSVGFLLQMSGRQDFELVNNVVSAILNVVLNLLLIPQWGISGAAVATGISLVINNLLGLVEVFFIHGLHPFTREYAKLLVAPLLAVAVFFAIAGTGVHWGYHALAVFMGFGVGLVMALNGHDRRLIGLLFQKFLPSLSP